MARATPDTRVGSVRKAGTALRLARRSSGVTVSQLASAAKVSRMHAYRMLKTLEDARQVRRVRKRKQPRGRAGRPAEVYKA